MEDDAKDWEKGRSLVRPTNDVIPWGRSLKKKVKLLFKYYYIVKQ